MIRPIASQGCMILWIYLWIYWFIFYSFFKKTTFIPPFSYTILIPLGFLIFYIFSVLLIFSPKNIQHQIPCGVIYQIKDVISIFVHWHPHLIHMSWMDLSHASVYKEKWNSSSNCDPILNFLGFLLYFIAYILARSIQLGNIGAIFLIRPQTTPCF